MERSERATPRRSKTRAASRTVSVYLDRSSSDTVRKLSAPCGMVPKRSEGCGSVRKGSASFRIIPNDSAACGTAGGDCVGSSSIVTVYHQEKTNHKQSYTQQQTEEAALQKK